MPKKLYRSTENKVAFGVAAGIANYFNVDPVLVRLLFVAAAVFGGGGLIAYIVAAIIIPEAPGLDSDYEYDDEDQADPVGNSRAFGMILVVLGAFFLAQNVLPRIAWTKFWPIALIALGLYVMTRMRSGDA